MSYALLMHYFKTLEYLLRNISDGLLRQRRAHMPGEVALLEVFHCNIQSLRLLEPSQELNK